MEKDKVSTQLKNKCITCGTDLKKEELPENTGEPLAGSLFIPLLFLMNALFAIVNELI